MMLKLFVSMQTRIAELRDREAGQTYVEYAVLIALVALGAIVLLGLFKNDIATAFSKLGTAVKNAAP
jgi:Flp pilus assembly pilin Flp